MTVRELIAELEKHNMDADVVTEQDHEGEDGYWPEKQGIWQVRKDLDSIVISS